MEVNMALFDVKNLTSALRSRVYVTEDDSNRLE